jgi:hypothetical protein
MFATMENLVAQLQEELKISKEEALVIIQSIAQYVENQHPLLNGITQDIVKKELEKQNNP